MVSIEKTSKSEKTVPKHYTLKINCLQDTEGKIVKPKVHVSF